MKKVLLSPNINKNSNMGLNSSKATIISAPATLSIMLNGFEPHLHARLHKKIVALVNRVTRKQQHKAGLVQDVSGEQP